MNCLVIGEPHYKDSKPQLTAPPLNRPDMLVALPDSPLEPPMPISLEPLQAAQKLGRIIVHGLRGQNKEMDSKTPEFQSLIQTLTTSRTVLKESHRNKKREKQQKQIEAIVTADNLTSEDMAQKYSRAVLRKALHKIEQLHFKADVRASQYCRDATTNREARDIYHRAEQETRQYHNKLQIIQAALQLK